MPELAPANVAVMATGQSDDPNQIDNVLAVPTALRGLLDCRATRCTKAIKLAAAATLAGRVPEPTNSRILPGVFDADLAAGCAAAIVSCAARPSRRHPQFLSWADRSMSANHQPIDECESGLVHHVGCFEPQLVVPREQPPTRTNGGEDE